MKLGSIAFRNIFRNSRRSLLSASAIAVAALSIVLLYSLLEGMTDDMSYNQQTYSTGGIRIRHSDFTKNERLNPMHLTVKNPEAIREIIMEQEWVKAVSPRITFPARIYRDEENFNAMGMGIDFDSEGEYQDLSSEIVKEGRLPENGQNEALIGYKLADKASVGIGDKITLLSTTAARGTNAITFKITGIAAFPLSGMNDTTFYAPLDRVQYFLRMPGEVQEILIKANEDVDPAVVVPELQSALAGEADLEILDWMNISTTFSMMEMASTMYDIFALFFFVLGCSVILNTTIMVIFERMKEIGTLGAMGMSGKDLVRLFFLESLYISIIGSFLGVFLGIIITQILNNTGIDLGSAMDGVDFDISTVIYPKLSLKSTLFVFVYSVIVASITSIFPSRKASRIEPVEALRAV